MPPRPEYWPQTLVDMAQRAQGDWGLLAKMIEEEFGVRFTGEELAKMNMRDAARKIWREIERSDPPF